MTTRSHVLAAIAALSACGGPNRGLTLDGATSDGPTTADAPTDASIPEGDPVAALAALPPVCSDSGWCWTNPTPAGTDYSNNYSSSPNNLWLIGGGPPSYAAVMQWDGQKWTSHRPPVPPGAPPFLLPMALSTLGPDNTWLIYDNVIEQWNGSAWTIIDALNSTATLNGVWVDPNGDGWVTSADGNIRRYHDGQLAQILPVGALIGAIWGTGTDDVFVASIGALFHYDGNTFKIVYRGNTVSSFQGVRNDVWISGAGGGIVHWDGTTATDLSPAGLTSQDEVGAAHYENRNDVSWVSNNGSMTYVHWDGTQVATTPIATAYSALGDNACNDLGSATLIGDKFVLFCANGEVDTFARSSSAAPIQTDIVIAPFQAAPPSNQTMWGTSSSNIYLANSDVRHWDGSAWTSLHRQSQISVVGLVGTDELFGIRVVDAGPNEANFVEHFDGSTWTSLVATQYPIGANESNINFIYPLGPDEAILVGGNGTALHYKTGSLTPIAAGTTATLTAILATDADHLSITGSDGTLLQWQRSDPKVFTRDPSFPATADNLLAIVHAGTTTWMVASQQDHVYRKTDGGAWQTVSTPGFPIAIAATDDNNVVANTSDSGIVDRWDGTAFNREYYPSWRGLRGLSALPDGTMLLTGLEGMIMHAPPP